MTGRVLSEEEIQKYESFANEGELNTDEALNLIATIRDRNKLLCIEKQSNRTLALMVDRAKEALEERDKTIAELQDSTHYAIGRAVHRLQQQNTILRELLLRSRGAGYNEECIFCGMKDRITDEALAKVRGDE